MEDHEEEESKGKDSKFGTSEMRARLTRIRRIQQIVIVFGVLAWWGFVSLLWLSSENKNIQLYKFKQVY